MTKSLKKTNASSTAANQQEDNIWTLARKFGDPLNFDKGWTETANPIFVPERLHIYATDSRPSILIRRPKSQTHRFVLIISLKGAGQICVDERILGLDVGQALLIFPFQFRHYISVQEGSVRWIFITFEISRIDSLEFRRYHPWHLTQESMQIMHHLFKAVSGRHLLGTRRAFEAQLWLAHLLYQRSAPETKPPLSSPPIFTEAHELLKRIQDFLYRHLDQPFKLDDMARGIGCSKSYLCHQFKEHFKISPGRYLTQMRLGKAEGLLRGSSLNISAVAQACGYGSVYAFSRTFRAAMKCSPRAYRIQTRK